MGRRRVVEQRLDRVRALENSVKETLESLSVITGMPVDQVDPDGSFRVALTALMGVGALRAGFDVIVTPPNAAFAVRVRHVDNAVNENAVSAEVLPMPDDSNEPTRASGLREIAQSGSAEEDEPAQVVSDLAALLWQGVGGLPS